MMEKITISKDRTTYIAKYILVSTMVFFTMGAPKLQAHYSIMHADDEKLMYSETSEQWTQWRLASCPLYGGRPYLVGYASQV